MAYSTLTIDFKTVPIVDDWLTISESKLGLTLRMLFVETRAAAGQVSIPVFMEYDGFHPERYLGFISSNYKNAFNTDYNSTNLFTVTAVSGAINSGIGTVTITANYADAVFAFSSFSERILVSVSNETFTPPPAGEIVFSPSELNFVHEQNTSFETKAVTISGDLWKVIGKPNFVLASATAGVTVTGVGAASGTYQIVYGSGSAIVSCTPTDYYDGAGPFLAADLSGSFEVLKNNVAFGAILITMAVTRLSDFLAVPYLGENKAFTLDQKYFEFYSTHSDTYFQFDAIIKTYDFFTHVLNEYFIPLKIVLFKGKAKENLGLTIHRVMRKFADVNASLLQYQEATLQVNCSEIAIADQSVIRSGRSAVISFLAGLSRGIHTVGFLDFNPEPNRVTIKGFAYLNILIAEGSYELREYKNGTLVNTTALPAFTGVVLCQKVLFAGYEKGDIIDFSLALVDQVISAVPQKTFIVFPDSNYSNMIVWENEFLLQSAMECTGTASLVPEGEFQSQTVYVDKVEQLEHLGTSKEVKLYINTGWLLFSDIDTVESLMRSKRAWLIQGSHTIALRAISKKLPSKDLQEELIQYPLEFKINQNYNEETYSLEI